MKRLQEETGVKMSILGKGSMRDKDKVWKENTFPIPRQAPNTNISKGNVWISTIAQKKILSTETNSSQSEINSGMINTCWRKREGSVSGVFNSVFCNSQLWMQSNESFCQSHLSHRLSVPWSHTYLSMYTDRLMDLAFTLRTGLSVLL